MAYYLVSSPLSVCSPAADNESRRRTSPASRASSRWAKGRSACSSSWQSGEHGHRRGRTRQEDSSNERLISDSAQLRGFGPCVDADVPRRYVRGIASSASYIGSTRTGSLATRAMRCAISAVCLPPAVRCVGRPPPSWFRLRDARCNSRGAVHNCHCITCGSVPFSVLFS